MSTDTALDVLTSALYTAVTAAITPTPLYNQPPPNAALPYLVMDAFTLGDWPAFGRVGREGTVTFDLWSESPSDTESNTLLASLADVLLIPAPRGSLPETLGEVWRLAEVRLDMVTTLRDPDDQTRHLSARFRFKMERD